jgi:8-oxo-dGTP pyrophosphatase MutT (NUDIX family)
MKILKTIRDEDFGCQASGPIDYRDRVAARAVVFDHNKKVALLHVTKNNYHKLPGGGVEEGESLEQGLRREILEEVGCQIKNIREVGIVEEYRNEFKLKQTSYCYIADVEGEIGAQKLEQGEIDEGHDLEWVGLDEAIKLLEKEKEVRNYEGKYIRQRDEIVLKQVKKLLEN